MAQALHPFLLALHTNLAADVAKLGIYAARTQGGTLEVVQTVQSQSKIWISLTSTKSFNSPPNLATKQSCQLAAVL